MDYDYQVLDWDTEFFGFTVAKILPYQLKVPELEKILTQLRREQLSLAYWASDPEDRESQEAAFLLKGFLADKKRTYIIDLKNLPEACQSEGGLFVEEFIGPVPDAELESLAIQAGVFSRFNVDPKIGKERFENLYRIWIQRSIDHTIAEAVFVVQNQGKKVGMITVGGKKACGHIGLLSVDETMRGKKIAEKLVWAAHDWFIAKGFTTGQVKTQGVNSAGCRLYENCGYRIESNYNFYHFWL